MKIYFLLFVFLLIVGNTYAGVLTGAAKIAGKIAKHGSDNAAEHVITHYSDDAARAAGKIAEDGADNAAEHAVTHYSDDAARAAVKGGGTAAVHTAPKVVKAVDATVEAARIEANATKPVVEAIHRTPIVKPGQLKPGHLVGGGVGVAAVVGTHNLTAGERDKDQALADATRETLAQHPEMLPEVVKIDGETGLYGMVPWAGRALICFSLIIGLALGIRILRPLFRRRKSQKQDDSQDASKPTA